MTQGATGHPRRDGKRGSFLGPLADRIGIQPLFILSGTACMLVALTWALTPSVRRAKDGPMAEEGPPQ